MDFLKEIKESPKERTVDLDNYETNKISNLTKLTALCWLHDYLRLFLYELEVKAKNFDNKEEQIIKEQDINTVLCEKLALIIKVVLLCLSDDEDSNYYFYLEVDLITCY